MDCVTDTVNLNIQKISPVFEPAKRAWIETWSINGTRQFITFGIEAYTKSGSKKPIDFGGCRMDSHLGMAQTY